VLRPLLALIACVTVVAVLSRPPEKRRGAYQRPLLARKEVLNILGAPYKHLISDYYWIQTTHQAGVARTQEEYRDVYYYADMTTDLDPRFRYAYEFAGVVVPFNKGRETWTNIEESTAILRKGLVQFPDDLFIRILLAYNLSYFHKDYKAAARLLEETSRLPRAPSYLAPLATRLYAQAGDVNAGLALASSLATVSQDPETREAFEKRVKELELERRLQDVERAAKQYHAREGRWPSALHELVVGGDLAVAPEDPFGGAIYLNEQGQAFSTSQQRRLRTFDPVLDKPQDD